MGKPADGRSRMLTPVEIVRLAVKQSGSISYKDLIDKTDIREAAIKRAVNSARLNGFLDYDGHKQNTLYSPANRVKVAPKGYALLEAFSEKPKQCTNPWDWRTFSGDMLIRSFSK